MTGTKTAKVMRLARFVFHLFESHVISAAQCRNVLDRLAVRMDIDDNAQAEEAISALYLRVQ